MMCATSSNRDGRNRVRLVNPLDGQPGHFELREFANADGLAMVHATVLESLERVRRDLCAAEGGEVYVIITDAVRTRADLERLARRYGWIDQGGAVARHSRHLADFGGIAVDLKAVRARGRRRIPQHVLGAVCRKYFDWVKDDYGDGHIHADNRWRS
jgi:hypothetical protein